ncbi:hypothetical protein F5Y15DRAFT_239710 [Xylariaceae sp. FL0016]|nr:hypothetical protein F5Y15DRAFT_239710 [Xylariaceae sp. FL0016]
MLLDRPAANDEEASTLLESDSLASRGSSDDVDEKPYNQPTGRSGRLAEWSRHMTLPELLRLLRSGVWSLLVFLVPSFLSNLRRKHAGGSHETSEKVSPTAYLDGLRGVAALVVYVFHFTYLWFPMLRKGYGSEPDAHLFWQLPIVRILHSGRASVTIFFVISGYVITIKTLSMIYRGQPDRVLESLSGSLFRRPLRLYLPIVGSSLVIFVLVRWDWFLMDPTRSGAPARFDTLGEQLYHWCYHTALLVNPFRPITGRLQLYSPPYDGHLWTIPVEFKGSLVVFTLLLAFSRTKRWIHIAAVIGIACWLVEMGDCDQAMFCAGLLLAELSLIAPPSHHTSDTTELPDASTSPQRPGTRASRTIRHAWTIALCVLGLHLCSYPERGGATSPGFATATRLVPAFYQGDEDRTQHFWLSLGSALFVLALMYSPPARLPRLRLRLRHRHRQRPRRPSSTAHHHEMTYAALPTRISSAVDPHHHHHHHPFEPGSGPGPRGGGRPQPLLQQPFTTALARYLGAISYSLYLCHGAVNHIVGSRLLDPAFAAWLDAMTTTTAAEAEEVLLLLGPAWRRYCGQAAWAALVNTAALFWVSDVFWRGVDAPAVRAARAVSEWAWLK